LAYCSSVG